MFRAACGMRMCCARTGAACLRALGCGVVGWLGRVARKQVVEPPLPRLGALGCDLFGPSPLKRRTIPLVAFAKVGTDAIAKDEFAPAVLRWRDRRECSSARTRCSARQTRRRFRHGRSSAECLVNHADQRTSLVRCGFGSLIGRSNRRRDHHREEAEVRVLRYMLKLRKLRFACGTNLLADRMRSACIPLAKKRKSVVRQIISTAARLYCRNTEERGETTTKCDRHRMNPTKPARSSSYLRLRACSRAAFCFRRSSKMSRSRNVAASAAGWNGSPSSLSRCDVMDELRVCCERPRPDAAVLGGISEGRSRRHTAELDQRCVDRMFRLIRPSAEDVRSEASRWSGEGRDEGMMSL